MTCADAHGECCKWARSGECARNRKYMLESCAAACGLCAGAGACDASHGCADADEHCAAWAAAGECTANAQYMAGSCARACGLCGAVGAAVGAARGASVRFEYAPHGPSGRHALTRRAVDPPVGFLPKCAYDNWAYSLVDALVAAATGRPLLEWIGDLVLRPLGAPASPRVPIARAPRAAGCRLAVGFVRTVASRRAGATRPRPRTSARRSARGRLGRRRGRTRACR